MSPVRLRADRARRIALWAQGLADPVPVGRVDVRHFRRVMNRVSLVQLDSVNVFIRTHYMPFFSRLGNYPRVALDDWLWNSGEIFEYWAHEASLIPVEHHPLLRWRMEGGWHWRRIERALADRGDILDAVEAEIAEKGPLRTADLDEPGERSGDEMWGWSDGKVVLEALFLSGRVTTATRRNFVRYYDLTDRVLPRSVLEVVTPAIEEAQTELLRRAVRSLGVATYDDLADYYRIRKPVARPLLESLVANGEVERVEVEGWGRSAYLSPHAVAPREVPRSTLLSPFDSLVWYRPRLRRLFGFDYRLEIYVPPARRVHGYYVLPYLMGGRFVARVDLKSDRRAGRLLVRGAFAEEGVDRRAAASSLARDLEAAASWLGLGEVEVEPNGDLADGLMKALG